MVGERREEEELKKDMNETETNNGNVKARSDIEPGLAGGYNSLGWNA